MLFIKNVHHKELGKAGFWIRFAANFLDGLLVSLPISLVLLFLFGFDIDSNWSNFVFSLYGILIPVYWYGFTVGKRAVRIKIVKMDGSNPTIGTMLMRDIVGGLVYLVTLGIGIIVSAFMIGTRPDKRSIHDFIAGTQVIIVDPNIIIEEDETLI